MLSLGDNVPCAVVPPTVIVATLGVSATFLQTNKLNVVCPPPLEEIVIAPPLSVNVIPVPAIKSSGFVTVDVPSFSTPFTLTLLHVFVSVFVAVIVTAPLLTVNVILLPATKSNAPVFVPVPNFSVPLTLMFLHVSESAPPPLTFNSLPFIDNPLPNVIAPLLPPNVDTYVKAASAFIKSLCEAK